MPSLFILTSTQRRFNINAPYTFKGVQYTSQALAQPDIQQYLGIKEITYELPPEYLASQDSYFFGDLDEAPYYTLVKKSDQQLYAQALSKAQDARAATYKSSTDALFFKEQRKEVPEGTWLAAVAAVKAEFPYPDPLPQETDNVSSTDKS